MRLTYTYAYTCTYTHMRPMMLCLSSGQQETQKVVAEAGALKLLVALLNEKDDHARRKGAGAIAALRALLD